MSSHIDESIPAEKLLEMENNKVVYEKTRKTPIKDKGISIHKPKYPTYFYIESSGILWLAYLFIPMFVPSSSFYEFYYFLFIVYIPFPLITTFLYLFVLPIEDRPLALIYRFVIFSISFTLCLLGGTRTLPPNEFVDDMYQINFLITLSILGNFMILKTYLMITKIDFKKEILKERITGSYSEHQWRKYDKKSYIIALIAGFFVMQFFWLLYHFLVRNKQIDRSKKRYILEKLEFDKEINITTISLELGISLEELTFILKQLRSKREIQVDFTRYGVILKEITSSKWLTPIIREKFATHLKVIRLSDIELKAKQFIELTERRKISEKDFRKIMGIRKECQINDLVIMLPFKVMKFKKPLFSKTERIFLNQNQALLKNDRIIKAFKEYSTEIFDI